MKKVDRLMAIILALNKKKKMTAKELADKFEVDVRTIYRDIQALSEMQVPIISQPGPEGGYSILGEYYIPPVVFDEDELFSLLISKKLIDEVYIPGYSKYIESSYLKIESIMPDKYLERIQEIRTRIKFDKTTRITPKKELEYFESIKKAFEQKVKIVIKKVCNQNLIKEIQIYPYGLIYVDEAWMVVAYNEGFNKIESIPISLIRDVELLEENFEIPEDFDIDLYYCHNHCIINCKNPCFEKVKIKVKKEGYNKIKDYLYFHQHDIISSKDYYTLTVKASKANCYVSLALRFYDIIEILEPKWLRNEIILQLKKLNDKYKIK